MWFWIEINIDYIEFEVLNGSKCRLYKKSIGLRKRVSRSKVVKMDKRSEENQSTDSDLGVPGTSINSGKREFDLSEYEFQPKNKIEKLSDVETVAQNCERDSCWFCERKKCKNIEPKRCNDDFKGDQLLNNRLLGERRIFLNSCYNMMWISFGLKPKFDRVLRGKTLQRLDVDFDRVVALCNSKEENVYFTPSQLDQLFELIRQIPGIKLDDMKPNFPRLCYDWTPNRCHQLKIIKREETIDDGVYHLYNGMAEIGGYIELDIRTLQRILDLENHIKTTHSMLSIYYAPRIFAELEKEILRKKIKADCKLSFIYKVNESMSEIGQRYWLELRRFLSKTFYDPELHLLDDCVVLFLEIINNFPDFVCEHLWYEEKLLEHNPKGQRFSGNDSDEDDEDDDENGDEDNGEINDEDDDEGFDEDDE